VKGVTVDAANTWVVTSLFVSGVMVTIRDVKGGGVPPIRLAIGLTTAGVMLGVLAQTSPRLTVGMSVLILLSSTLVAGAPALDILTKALGGKQSRRITNRPPQSV
jgi:hypothetical protein